MPSAELPPIALLARRGLARRCPACGEGQIFSTFVRLRRRCTHCGLRLLRNQGDLWAFLLFLDRGLVLFPLVIAYYFGLFPESGLGYLLLGAVVLGAFVATMPHRNGLCLAIDYYTRLRWDPSALFDEP